VTAFRILRSLRAAAGLAAVRLFLNALFAA
jgi:hypothetical protein